MIQVRYREFVVTHERYYKLCYFMIITVAHRHRRAIIFTLFITVYLFFSIYSIYSIIAV